MNKLDKNFKNAPYTKEIGYVNIQLEGTGLAKNVFSMEQENGDTLLLTNINDYSDKSRLVVQDLKGNELQELIRYTNGVVTVDDEKIYAFLTKDGIDRFYRFDKKSLELEYKKTLGDSSVRSVCYNKNELCTFDMIQSEVQIRDKDGNVLESKDTRRPNYGISLTFVFPAYEQFRYSRYGELIGDQEHLNGYENKYGKIIKENARLRNVAYDESTRTMFKASNNIVYVNSPGAMEGILYYPKRIICGISVDPQINSLIVSSYNPANREKSFIEILPMSLVLYKMRASEDYLTPKNRHKQQTMPDNQYPSITHSRVLEQDNFARSLRL